MFCHLTSTPLCGTAADPWAQPLLPGVGPLACPTVDQPSAMEDNGQQLIAHIHTGKQRPYGPKFEMHLDILKQFFWFSFFSIIFFFFGG